jgi:hypothetical protein
LLQKLSRSSLLILKNTHSQEYSFSRILIFKNTHHSAQMRSQKVLIGRHNNMWIANFKRNRIYTNKERVKRQLKRMGGIRTPTNYHCIIYATPLYTAHRDKRSLLPCQESVRNSYDGNQLLFNKHPPGSLPKLSSTLRYLLTHSTARA